MKPNQILPIKCLSTVCQISHTISNEPGTFPCVDSTPMLDLKVILIANWVPSRVLRMTSYYDCTVVYRDHLLEVIMVVCKDFIKHTVVERHPEQSSETGNVSGWSKWAGAETIRSWCIVARWWCILVVARLVFMIPFNTIIQQLPLNNCSKISPIGGCRQHVPNVGSQCADIDFLINLVWEGQFLCQDALWSFVWVYKQTLPSDGVPF